MCGNFFLNLFMYDSLPIPVRASSLQLLWGMINVLQLIIHMPLFNISFPANAQFFYALIVDIANFDILPMDQIQALFFEFTETESDEQFNQMGITSTNVVENLGSAFLYILMIGGGIAFAILMKFISRKYPKVAIVYNWLSKQLFFNLILRFFLEAYLQIAIDSLMNIQDMRWATSGDKFAAIFSILLLGTVALFPLMIWLILSLNFKTLGTQKSADTFGALFGDLRLDKKSCLLYNVFFVLRRLIFASLATLFDPVPFAQIQLLVLQCLLLIIYVQLVKPFENPALNKLEIFNEICIVGVAYHLIIFTEFVADPNLHYQGGWSIILITILNILVNMGYIVKETYVSLKATLKKLKLKYKACMERKKAKKYVDSHQPDDFDQFNYADQSYAFQYGDKIKKGVAKYDGLPYQGQVESLERPTFKSERLDINPHNLESGEAYGYDLTPNETYLTNLSQAELLDPLSRRTGRFNQSQIKKQKIKKPSLPPPSQFQTSIDSNLDKTKNRHMHESNAFSEQCLSQHQPQSKQTIKEFQVSKKVDQNDFDLPYAFDDPLPTTSKFAKTSKNQTLQNINSQIQDVVRGQSPSFEREIRPINLKQLRQQYQKGSSSQLQERDELEFDQ